MKQNLTWAWGTSAMLAAVAGYVVGAWRFLLNGYYGVASGSLVVFVLQLLKGSLQATVWGVGAFLVVALAVMVVSLPVVLVVTVIQSTVRQFKLRV